ncbi:MAG: TonB-dependent receptor plug domain-containing protein [Psychroflexus halocasei]
MSRILFLFLCLPLIGSAQNNISAHIYNSHTNEPLQNVELKLFNVYNGFKQLQTTSSAGVAHFKSVPSLDGFQIVFNGNSQFKQAKSEVFNLRSNENPTIILYAISTKSEIQNLDEVIISSKNQPQLNRRDAEVSFEINSKEIEQIPVEGRSISKVLHRLPNVTKATGFFTEAPNVSVNGANPLFTNYTVDGLDNNERFLGGMRFAIPSGAVKNMTVFTSNYSAEYGLTHNAVIDVTTKSGRNHLEGEVFFLTRPGSVIDASSPFAQRDLSGNQVKDGFARYQSGFSLGGPLVKNKTFFFINYEHTTDVKDNLLNSPDLGISETIRGNNNFDYITAKIDQHWSPKFRSSLRANLGLITIDNQGGGLDGGVAFPSAGFVQERNSFNLAFKNAYYVDNFDFETNFQYSRFHWDYSKSFQDGPQVTIRNPQEFPIAIIGNNGTTFDELENTFQFQQKVSYFYKNHTFKAGFQFLSGDHQLFGGGNPDGNYLVDLSQNQLDFLRSQNFGSRLSPEDLPADVDVVNYNVELNPNSFGATQRIYSFYLEDEWQASRNLKLTFGLRYDYDNLSKGGATKGDKNNIAPRLNFNYQLSKNSVIRGGYAIAYDKINYAIYSDALQQNTTSDAYKQQLQALIDQGILPQNTSLDRITFDGNLVASLPDVPYLNAPTASDLQNQRESIFSNERRILNPNGYQNPYSHQFSLGYQTKIDGDKLFFIDLFHNRGEDLFRLRNLNAAEEMTIDQNFTAADVRTVEEADASRPIPIKNNQGFINGQWVDGVARNIVMTESKGQSEYWAASFNFQKSRGDDAYELRLNYTISSLKNNTEDINFRAQDANNYEAEWGPSINDRTHNINGILTYFPLKNTQLTFAGLLQSGQPINRIPDAEIYGTTDLNGDGSGFGEAYLGNSDRSPGESRNNDRLPWSFNFDLGAQYQFVFNENSCFIIRADIFNVFNIENLSGYSNNATQSNQIQIGSKSSGRFVQRNAGPPRQFQFGLTYLF